MKKICIAAMLCFTAVFLCSCSQNNRLNTSNLENFSVENVSEEKIDNSPGTIKDDDKETQMESEKDFKSETAVSTGITRNSTVSGTATALTTTSTLAVTTKSENLNADKGSETFGLSKSELIDLAQSKYSEALSTYNKFIYQGAYSVDESQMYFTNEGDSMVLITDPRIKSIDDVQTDFENTFSSKYESPVPMHYLEKDGKVYYIQSDRGQDSTYQGTIITDITKITDTEVFFNAHSTYSDGTTKDNAYSLVHNEGNAEWKTGVFTLPN